MYKEFIKGGVSSPTERRIKQDIYPIGSIIYNLLFRKLPEYPRDVFVDWLAKFSVNSEDKLSFDIKKFVIGKQQNEEKKCFRLIFKEFFEERQTIFSEDMRDISSLVFDCSRILVQDRCSSNELLDRLESFLKNQNSRKAVDILLASVYKNKCDVQYLCNAVQSLTPSDNDEKPPNVQNNRSAERDLKDTMRTCLSRLKYMYETIKRGESATHNFAPKC